MNTLETVKTLNAAARTGIAAVVVAGAGIVGYQGYELYQAPQLALEKTKHELEQVQTDLAISQKQVGALTATNKQQSEQIDRLETSIGLLKVNYRLAELHVLGQTGSAADGTLVTTIAFAETSEDGRPLAPPSAFEIDGNLVYVDYLVAKFDDKYVEDANLDRSTALCVFHRIFGENQEPSEGFELDRAGDRPSAYGRGKPMSEFERKIWSDFWTIANDPEKAQELGIRAAHGIAASIRVEPGKKYRLRLRSTGELSIRPIDE